MQGNKDGRAMSRTEVMVLLSGARGRERLALHLTHSTSLSVTAASYTNIPGGVLMLEAPWFFKSPRPSVKQ